MVLVSRGNGEARMNDRRRFFQNAAVFGAGFLGLRETLRAGTPESGLQTPHENERGRHHSPYGSPGAHPATASQTARDHALPMVTPDVADLAHEMDCGVKVFQLAAEPVDRKSTRLNSSHGMSSRMPSSA